MRENDQIFEFSRQPEIFEVDEQETRKRINALITSIS